MSFFHGYRTGVPKQSPRRRNVYRYGVTCHHMSHELAVLRFASTRQLGGNRQNGLQFVSDKINIDSKLAMQLFKLVLLSLQHHKARLKE